VGSEEVISGEVMPGANLVVRAVGRDGSYL
jgi:hypothetical protein